MSNTVKQSLEENMDDILKNLPEEFHEDLKASIETAAPSSKLTDEEAVIQASELMRDNPDIDHEACIPLLAKDTRLNRPIPQPYDAELELQKQAAIAEVKNNLPVE